MLDKKTFTDCKKKKKKSVERWRMNSTSCNSLELAKSQSGEGVQRKKFSVVISSWRWKPIHCIRNYICDLKNALFLIFWSISLGWKKMNKKSTIVHPQNVWCCSSERDSCGLHNATFSWTHPGLFLVNNALENTFHWEIFITALDRPK